MLADAGARSASSRASSATRAASSSSKGARGTRGRRRWTLRDDALVAAAAEVLRIRDAALGDRRRGRDGRAARRRAAGGATSFPAGCGCRSTRAHPTRSGSRADLRDRLRAFAARPSPFADVAELRAVLREEIERRGHRRSRARLRRGPRRRDPGGRRSPERDALRAEPERRRQPLAGRALRRRRTSRSRSRC